MNGNLPIPDSLKHLKVLKCLTCIKMFTRLETVDRIKVFIGLKSLTRIECSICLTG